MKYFQLYPGSDILETTLGSIMINVCCITPLSEIFGLLSCTQQRLWTPLTPPRWKRELQVQLDEPPTPILITKYQFCQYWWFCCCFFMPPVWQNRQRNLDHQKQKIKTTVSWQLFESDSINHYTISDKNFTAHTNWSQGGHQSVAG